MRNSSTLSLIKVAILGLGSLSTLAAENINLPPGAYTGAGQVMIVAAGKKIQFRDHLGIQHIRIHANGTLTANFPGKINPLRLQITNHKPRLVWETIEGGKVHRVTAIPFAPEMYAFRLEVLEDGKITGGAQQFYAIPRKLDL
jgi:hypothetical protein